MSIEEKNIGDALTRCFLTKDAMYHSIAMVPESDEIFIPSKCQASMKADPKVQGKTDDSLPKKMEYLVIMELIYSPTEEMEDQNDLDVLLDWDEYIALLVSLVKSIVGTFRR